MTRLSRSLFGDLDVEVEMDAPIGVESWFCAGGRADFLVRPRTAEALSEILKRSRQIDTPVRIMGEGANLLVDDDGVPGIVIRLDAPAFRAVEHNVEGRLELVRVGAGADLARTLMRFARAGTAGLESLMGVPASIGGAVRMNAGGAYGEIGDVVHAVACLDSGGRVRVYGADELRFDYRSTNIVDPIILWAVFRVSQENPIALRERIKEIAAHKKRTQPLGDKSAGCMFRNPVDPDTGVRTSAGRIIDEVGLKGLRHGSATVSTHHANFFTIDRNGRARDAIELGDLVRDRVLDARGIELHREVVVWDRTDDERIGDA
ncbi:MAG: UDP-N-acetylenolpyruvoylglucosamine reductase [Planctomycetaceae bacterium]|nr:UDP-N-acetylenolpyruvoylglucosamine reductase [Planctomycetaceae bacterium]